MADWRLKGADISRFLKKQRKKFHVEDISCSTIVNMSQFIYLFIYLSFTFFFIFIFLFLFIYFILFYFNF